MNEIELLTKQTSEAYEWVNTLVDPVEEEKWNIIPPEMATNLTWQVGHLLLSYYFHSIVVIRGHQMDVIKQMPIRDYSSYFNTGHPKDAIGKFPHSNLVSQFRKMQEKSLDIINSLALDELYDPLEPTEFPHPIAKNKLEALDWNVKHTMWHCGQIAIVKRIVDKRHDFGLPRN